MPDIYGYSCAPTPVPECPPLSLCEIDCDHICSIMQLLPYGAAWTPKGEGAKEALICEPYQDCDICEPVFLRNFIRFMSLQYARTRAASAWVIAQANPLTAPDRGYWLRRWGLDKILNVLPKRVSSTTDSTAAFFIDCAPECSSAEVLCVPNADQQAAIEYAMIRAHVFSSRPDFVPSMTNINRVMSLFGYRVERPGDITTAQGAIPAKWVETKANVCATDGLFVYSEVNTCSNYIAKLRLSPISDCLTRAPGNPCEAKPVCDVKEDEWLLCETIQDTSECVSAICDDNTLNRPAAVYAAAYLRRIWPVWQPYEIVEIVQQS